MLSDGLQEDMPLDEFTASQLSSREDYGAIQSRDRIKVTWTKDGPRVPAPGVYVAIDANNRYEAKGRHCGYIILHRAPGSDGFVINRTHDVGLSEDTIQTITANQGAMQLELIWRLATGGCPNYTPPPLPDIMSEGLEYDSAQAAYDAVSTKPGIERRIGNGLEILFDEANMTAWSFAPEGDPYYPTVVKRAVFSNETGGASMSMSMHCGGDKAACDALYFELAALNGLIQVSSE